MPNWSFRADWSEGGGPASPGLPVPELRTDTALVMEPTLNDAIGNMISRERYDVSLTVDGGIKCLVIDLDSATEVPVLAMVPGQVACDGDRSILTTEVFSFTGMMELIQEVSLFPELLRPPPSQGPYPIRWFRNWIDAGRVPPKVIYENLVEDDNRVCDDTVVRAGQAIGNIGSHPTVAGKKQIRLKIEYIDSTNDAPRFMHPREFFSLLFWSEACDPFFSSDTSNPPLRDYENPLLQKMMRRYDDGSPVISGSDGAVDEINEILNSVSNRYDNVDRWLGLRPPLRIYKRIEWEARATHYIHHDNWQRADTEPPPYGDLVDVLRNPFITIGAPMRFSSKCNLLAGELAFRSGFRPFVSIAGNHLSYQSGNSFINPRCNTADCDRDPIRIRSAGTIHLDGVDYRIDAVRGRKRYFHSDNIEAINRDIQENGKGILYARQRYCLLGTTPPYPARGVNCDDGTRPKSFHVMVLANLDGISSNSITADIIDQHIVLPDIPRNCPSPSYCGFRDSSGRAFIEMAPGGDPSENWGVLDLNGLEVP